MKFIKLFEYSDYYFNSIDDLLSVMPRNTKKKRFLRFLFTNKCFINLIIYLSKKNATKDLESKVFEILQVFNINPDVIHFNKSRNPLRVYVWGQDESNYPVFIKISLREGDFNFHHELKAIEYANKKISSDFIFKTFCPIRSEIYLKCSVIFYESIPINMIGKRKSLNESELIFYKNKLCNIHSDINSENIFFIGSDLYVIDWENNLGN